MRCLDVDWKTDNLSEWHSLWFAGDQHTGAAGCETERIKENVAEIKADPRARVALMGDAIDAITFTDKRFDFRQVADNMVPYLDDLPKRAADQFVELYDPIREKIVLMIPGNHDETIRKKYHFDVAGYIAGSLGVPLLDTVSQVRLRLKVGADRCGRSMLVKGIVSHAYKGSVTLGGKIAAAERIFDYFGSHDFIAQAHMHEYAVHEGVNLDVWGSFGKPKVHERQRIMFLTGSYLKTYGPGSGYGETRAYRPCRLGSPHLSIRMKRTNQTDINGRHKRDKVELRGS